MAERTDLIALEALDRRPPAAQAAIARAGTGTRTGIKFGRGPGTRGLMVLGYGIIIVFFGAIIGWAGTAPLVSAAIAPGMVSIEGQRKTVQHLEGGIVEAILVREGESVRRGQKLIELDTTRIEAELEALDVQRVSAAALVARLRAERVGAPKVSFPAWLIERTGEPLAREAIEVQTSLFSNRGRSFQGQRQILEQRVAEHEAELQGLAGEASASERQLLLLEEQLVGLRRLVAKGLYPRSQLLALEREKIELEGQLSMNLSGQSAIRQRRMATHLELMELEASRASEIETLLHEGQEQAELLASQVKAARDMVSRATIRAPTAGTIVNLQVHTQGGVIAPGAPLLDIVPDGGRLIIECRLDPKDRDVVAVGQRAEIRFIAFSQRTTSRVHGRLSAISADRFDDERTGLPYYRAVIELTEDPSVALDGADIYPGMQAEVLIVTGERTPLAYLLRPILYSVQRAMREE